MKLDKTHITFKSDLKKFKNCHEQLSKLLKHKFKNIKKPVLIAVGGPGGTGKSTFAKKLALSLGDTNVLTLDDYKTSRSFRSEKKIFGPHPKANELKMVKSHLDELALNKTIKKPKYCSDKGMINSYQKFSPAKFIIVEGEISTYKLFKEQIDFSIFIDASWKTQLNTRITRDIEQRGYTPEKAISTFLNSNLREFSKYGASSKSWADVHIHCNEKYDLKIESICEKLIQHL